MQLRIYFNLVCQVLVCFFSCTWIRWFIEQCYQRVIWWQRWQGIRQNFNILPCRMDMFFFISVSHCGFAACWYSGNCSFLFLQASISACFFRSCAYSCTFLISSSYLQASSWRWRSSSLSWVLLIASLWRNTHSNPCLASFIMQKSEEACGCLFLSGWDQRASLRWSFFQIILCWRLIQTKNIIMQNFTLQIMRVLKNLLNK